MSGESAERGVMDGAKRSVGRSPFRPSALARPPLHICPSSHTAYYRPSVPFPSPPTENDICTGAPSSVDLSSCVNLGPSRMYDLREAFFILVLPLLQSTSFFSPPRHVLYGHALCRSDNKWTKLEQGLARSAVWRVVSPVAATDSAAFIQSLSGPACVT